MKVLFEDQLKDSHANPVNLVAVEMPTQYPDDWCVTLFADAMPIVVAMPGGDWYFVRCNTESALAQVTVEVLYRLGCLTDDLYSDFGTSLDQQSYEACLEAGEGDPAFRRVVNRMVQSR